METSAPPKISAGAAYYSTAALKLYDLWVLSISCTYAWRCSTRSITLPFFIANANASRTHLDIGAGTGYFPSALVSHASTAGEKSALESITLVDLNENTLLKAAARVRGSTYGAELSIRTVQADALKAPLPLQAVGEKPQKFDSISLSYIIHCLPGPVAKKAAIFKVAKEHLAEDGILFGVTVLGEEAGHGWFGRRLISWYNRVGIFDNVNDTREELAAGLRENFGWVEEWVEGKVWMFRARHKQ